jgi:hypothetical protein
MNEESWSERARVFLEKQSVEYEGKIKKLKRKRKTVKVLFTSFIVISITCSTVCAGLGGFAVPAVVISALSISGALSTALSLKFKLKRKQNEYNRTIEQLDKVKRKIDYIVGCNGNFTQREYEEIIGK